MNGFHSEYMTIGLVCHVNICVYIAVWFASLEFNLTLRLLNVQLTNMKMLT